MTDEGQGQSTGGGAAGDAGDAGQAGGAGQPAGGDGGEGAQPAASFGGQGWDHGTMGTTEIREGVEGGRIEVRDGPPPKR